MIEATIEGLTAAIKAQTDVLVKLHTAVAILLSKSGTLSAAVGGDTQPPAKEPVQEPAAEKAASKPAPKKAAPAPARKTGKGDSPETVKNSDIPEPVLQPGNEFDPEDYELPDLSPETYASLIRPAVLELAAIDQDAMARLLAEYGVTSAKNLKTEQWQSFYTALMTLTEQLTAEAVDDENEGLA
jgi:hypothetical protein